MNDNPFREALRWLGPNGEKWWKLWDDHPVNSGGCAIIALSRVVDRIETPRCDLGALLDEVASELFPDRGRRVEKFNDHPDTTFEDIRTVFEKAAVRWDERV